MLVDGGFGDGSRIAFAALAWLAFAICLVSRKVDRSALLSPAPIALAGLALLSAASSAWTVAEPSDAVLWGFAISGLGALALASASVSVGPGGVVPLAAILVVVALVAALEGLIGFVLREKPLALHLAGEWQAAGPFEYPPTLALLQLSALPALMRAMVVLRVSLAAAAAAGAAVSALAIALSGSRIAIALTIALALMAVLEPRRALQEGRQTAALACAAALGLPAAAVLIADPADPAAALASDGLRIAFLAGVVAGVAIAWAAIRRHRADGHAGAAGAGGVHVGRAPVAAAIAILVAAMAIGTTELSERSGPGVEASAGALHGRDQHWEAAIETIGERPLQGAGAEAYYLASVDHQGARPVLYAHNLPLEAMAELGLFGGALVFLLYAGAGVALWRARSSARLWLFGPAVVAFALVNLVDWSWHLAGAGAVFALALGGLLATRDDKRPR